MSFFFFSEASDDSSEMNEAKSPQDPPSTPPRMTQGTDEGFQVSEGRLRSPDSELFYSKVDFLSPLFIITALGASLTCFFLIKNSPHDILISQR